MRIGLHTWAPGLNGKPDAVSGIALTVRYLIDWLTAQGNDIVWYGKDAVPLTQQGTLKNLDTLDVLIVMWRWKLPPQYEERNDAYYRQWLLLAKAAAINLPILVHDQDMMIQDHELKALGQMNCLLTMPALSPPPGYVTLHYPQPHYGVPATFWQTREGLAYIGNNYGRYYQTVSYLNPISQRVKTQVWGNWLEPNENRTSPETVRSNMPNVKFCGRLPHHRVVEALSFAKSTIHLAKPEMNHVGYIAVRWNEAAAAGTPAIIPHEMGHHREIRKLGMLATPDMAGDIAFSFENHEQFALDEAMKQREWMRSIAEVEPWAEILESIAR